MEVKFETKGQLRQKRRLERSQRQRRKECSRRSKGAETSYREEGAIKIQRSTATGHDRELQKPKGKEKKTRQAVAAKVANPRREHTMQGRTVEERLVLAEGQEAADQRDNWEEM